MTRGPPPPRREQVPKDSVSLRQPEEPYQEQDAAAGASLGQLDRGHLAAAI